MLDKSFSETSYDQSEPPLVQLEAISSYLVTGYLGEEINFQLAPPSCQGLVESKKISLELLFSRLSTPQVPQLLLIRLLLQTLPQTLSVALLWTFYSTSMSF